MPQETPIMRLPMCVRPYGGECGGKAWDNRPRYACDPASTLARSLPAGGFCSPGGTTCGAHMCGRFHKRTEGLVDRSFRPECCRHFGLEQNQIRSCAVGFQIFSAHAPPEVFSTVFGAQLVTLNPLHRFSSHVWS